MKRFSPNVIVALSAFAVSLTVVAILTVRPSLFSSRNASDVVDANQIKKEDSATEPSKGELPEETAIRVAEEFVLQNGYTDLPADKSKLSYETVEFSPNIDEMLRSRANSVERGAFGILYRASGTKMGEEGWTVVFRSMNISDDFYKSLSRQTGKKVTKDTHPIGRAVTMDKNFQNLLLEHKTFPLSNVDKKL